MRDTPLDRKLNLATRPAEIDIESMKRAAAAQYDDAATQRIGKHAEEIRRELERMHSKCRANQALAYSICSILNVQHTDERKTAIFELIHAVVPERYFDPGEKRHN